MKGIISHPYILFILYLFDVLGILVLMFNYVVKGGSLCGCSPSKHPLHVHSIANRAMLLRKFSTLSDISPNVSPEAPCNAEDGGEAHGFNISPENIVEVFNTKAMKNLSPTGLRMIRDEKVRNIFLRCETLGYKI